MIEFSISISPHVVSSAPLIVSSIVVSLLPVSSSIAPTSLVAASGIVSEKLRPSSSPLIAHMPLVPVPTSMAGATSKVISTSPITTLISEPFIKFRQFINFRNFKVHLLVSFIEMLVNIHEALIFVLRDIKNYPRLVLLRLHTSENVSQLNRPVQFELIPGDLDGVAPLLAQSSLHL